MEGGETELPDSNPAPLELVKTARLGSLRDTHPE